MHEYYMRLALQEAEAARDEQEVPVGAVIVQGDRVVASAHNQREQLHDPTAHAEMIAITQAASVKKDWRLDDCVMYVTLEPCPMCAGAIVLARMPVVVYGASDPKGGAAQTLFRLLDNPRLNHRAEIVAGVLEDRCGSLADAVLPRATRTRQEVAPTATCMPLRPECAWPCRARRFPGDEASSVAGKPHTKSLP